ncbi:MAG: tetratricopeptide repeat protein [Anaerolineales bacterium]
MNNFELWNELGNLYFMQGAYEPAIHAYLRSIELETRFGRSYSNLAMAFVQVGKYAEAIKLYRRSIALLPNEKEKAITWNKLGILYRQVKDYSHALEAYQQADFLDPQHEGDRFSEAVLGSKMPLTVSKPDIDIESLISAEQVLDDSEKRDFHEINAELGFEEEDSNISWFGSKFLPADREQHFPREAVRESMAGIHSKWKPAMAEETEIVETPVAANKELETAALEYPDIIIPIDLEINPQSELDHRDLEDATPNEEIDTQLVETIEENELVQDEVPFEHSRITESAGGATLSENETKPTMPSPAEGPLKEQSETVSDPLEVDIEQCKLAAQKNSRNYAVWEALGDAYKAAGRYKDAISAYQTAISVNSIKPSSYYRLGLAYAVERMETEAVATFQKVLELDPDHAQAHASLASQYLRMGQEELAQSHIEKALNAHLEDETEYNRACLEAICGNNDRALELLEIALQSKQTYIDWAHNDPDLDPLRSDHRFQDLLSTYATSV